MLRIVLFFAIWLVLPPFAHAQTVRIFAASSLIGPLQAMTENIKQATGHQPQWVFAASLTLARQIEQGAPADIFISADDRSMQFLEDKRLIIANSKRALLSNALVLIAPSHASTQAGDAASILRQLVQNGERLAMGDPNYVPAGQYAQAALQSLGLWTSISPRGARFENVRSVLNAVERGAVPLGIVYTSDAHNNSKVKTLAKFAANSHPKIIYPIALIDGRNPDAARKVYDYLRAPQAQAFFVQFGFILPDAQ